MGAECSTETSATAAEDFEAAEAFAGARPGWAFRAGDRGTGYYRDGRSEPVKADSPTDWVVVEARDGESSASSGSSPTQPTAPAAPAAEEQPAAFSNDLLYELD